MKNRGKQLIWQNYQKDIADDHFFYVRSCIRQNFFPGAETTFLRILKDVLNKDVYDDPSHTTCTGIGYHTDIVPLETTMTVVARQFALMTEKGYKNFIPSCVTSFGLYLEILETWHNYPEVLEKTRSNLMLATGRSFVLPENIVHASDVIYKFRSEIAKKAKYRLVNIHTGKPLKVVEHIGCHYAKMFPDKSVGGAEFPRVLSGIIEEWGGEVIDYPERRHCCGFGFRQYFIKANRGYTFSSVKKKFDSMSPYEPDLIVTNCPGCNVFLDKGQYVISEQEGIVYSRDGYGIPVLTFEELTGVVLGFDPWDIGLQVHQVSVEPLLDKIGVKYDIQKKYTDKNNRLLGKPVKPTLLKTL
ncbi:MAG: heterodisulfide reductase-related iron-sulfur binding cluster [Bacteroidales bacterium]|nr:heterodisulfide reductase-related iron-sulfur binding cluster [Bacteroidales bacterium]